MLVTCMVLLSGLGSLPLVSAQPVEYEVFIPADWIHHSQYVGSDTQVSTIEVPTISSRSHARSNASDNPGPIDEVPIVGYSEWHETVDIGGGNYRVTAYFTSHHSWFRFDLSSIPSSAEVVSADVILNDSFDGDHTGGTRIVKSDTMADATSGWSTTIICQPSDLSMDGPATSDPNELNAAGRGYLADNLGDFVLMEMATHSIAAGEASDIAYIDEPTSVGRSPVLHLVFETDRPFITNRPAQNILSYHLFDFQAQVGQAVSSWTFETNAPWLHDLGNGHVQGTPEGQYSQQYWFSLAPRNSGGQGDTYTWNLYVTYQPFPVKITTTPSTVARVGQNYLYQIGTDVSSTFSFWTPSQDIALVGNLVIGSFSSTGVWPISIKATPANPIAKPSWQNYSLQVIGADDPFPVQGPGLKTVGIGASWAHTAIGEGSARYWGTGDSTTLPLWWSEAWTKAQNDDPDLHNGCAVGTYRYGRTEQQYPPATIFITVIDVLSARSWFSFDLTSIPPWATVQSAILHMGQVDNGRYADTTIRFYGTTTEEDSFSHGWNYGLQLGSVYDAQPGGETVVTLNQDGRAYVQNRLQSFAMLQMVADSATVNGDHVAIYYTPWLEVKYTVTPPMIFGSPPTEIGFGEYYDFAFTADQPRVAWSIKTDAPWMDLLNNRVLGTPTIGQTGTYSFSLTATNANGTSYRNWTVTVGFPDWNPGFVTSPPLSCKVGYTYEYRPQANVTVTLSLYSGPPWLQFYEGLLTGVPGDDELGVEHQVSIMASYGTWRSWQNFTITISSNYVPLPPEPEDNEPQPEDENWNPDQLNGTYAPLPKAKISPLVLVAIACGVILIIAVYLDRIETKKRKGGKR